MIATLIKYRYFDQGKKLVTLIRSNKITLMKNSYNDSYIGQNRSPV